MTIEPTLAAGLIGGAAGILLGVIPLWIWARRAQAAARLETARLREEAEVRQLAAEAQMEGLARHMGTLETSLRNSDEILREDRLNQATRARAMQLLRAGIAPDSAAATLSLPRLELRLLARVSRLLGATK